MKYYGDEDKDNEEYEDKEDEKHDDKEDEESEEEEDEESEGNKDSDKKLLTRKYFMLMVNTVAAATKNNHCFVPAACSIFHQAFENHLINCLSERGFLRIEIRNQVLEYEIGTLQNENSSLKMEIEDLKKASLQSQRKYFIDLTCVST